MHASLEPDAQLRLVLQRRARTNLRRHLQRGFVRVAVLVTADLVSFVLMRAAIRAVRDRGLLGPGLAELTSELMPRGLLSGWEYAVGLFMALALTGNYQPGTARRDPGRLFTGVALATALPLWASLWNRGLELVAMLYLTTLLLVWLGLLVERKIIDRLVAIVRPPERNAAPTLFVGSSRSCKRAMAMGAFGVANEHRPIGYVSTEAVPAADALGPVHHFPQLLHDSHAEAVVICGDLDGDQLHHVVDASFAAGCHVLAIPKSLSALGVQPSVLWRDDQPLLQLTQPVLRARALVIKRIIDFIGAAVGLVLLAPLFLVLGVAITLDSRGPVLFRQKRVGLGGRTFGMLKFRTMVYGADDQKQDVAHLNQTGDSRLFKIPNDPRVTRMGRFLRRWSLDEIPQLWNVFVGDMSLVGPRPFFPGDLAEYELHHFDRLGAKPGMTGLWQVSGRSSVTDFEEVVRLDRKYIVNWSLGLDVWILLRTLPAVVSRNGAF